MEKCRSALNGLTMRSNRTGQQQRSQYQPATIELENEEDRYAESANHKESIGFMHAGTGSHVSSRIAILGRCNRSNFIKNEPPRRLCDVF